MRVRGQQFFLQILLPILLVAIATFINESIPSLRNKSSLFIFLGAVVISVNIGGWAAGFLATTLSMVSALWFLIPPTRSLAAQDSHDVFRLFMFMLVAVMIVAIHIGRSKAQVALRASEQRLMLALESGALGVWDYNLLTREFWRSKALEKLYGRGSQNFADTYARFFSYVHFDDQPSFNRAITRTIEEGTDYEVEHRIVLPDESVRWISTRGRIFFNDSSRAERIVGIAVDITAQKQDTPNRSVLAAKANSVPVYSAAT